MTTPTLINTTTTHLSTPVRSPFSNITNFELPTTIPVFYLVPNSSSQHALKKPEPVSNTLQEAYDLADPFNVVSESFYCPQVVYDIPCFDDLDNFSIYRKNGASPGTAVARSVESSEPSKRKAEPMKASSSKVESMKASSSSVGPSKPSIAEEKPGKTPTRTDRKTEAASLSKPQQKRKEKHPRPPLASLSLNTDRQQTPFASLLLNPARTNKRLVAQSKEKHVRSRSISISADRTVPQRDLLGVRVSQIQEQNIVRCRAPESELDWAQILPPRSPVVASSWDSDDLSPQLMVTPPTPLKQQSSKREGVPRFAESNWSESGSVDLEDVFALRRHGDVWWKMECA